MMLRAFACLALLAAVVSDPGVGQNLTKTGTSSAPFLKIAIGPRAVGMGGAYTAMANDLSAMYWNPAGLASLYANEAVFSRIQWFAGIHLNFAAAATHVAGLGTLGVGVTVMGMGEMEVRSLEAPTGTGERFNAGALAVGLTYGRNLTDQFSIGFSAKYVQEYIWNSSATGFAVDIGTMYRIPILNELRLAASICNFGTKMKMKGRDNILVTQVGGAEGNLINTDIELDEYDLPLVFRVGLAADVMKSDENRLTAAVDAVHPNDNTEYLNTGLEYGWNEMVFLRGGWKSLFERDTEQGFTIGLGLRYRIGGVLGLQVDYAYQDWGRLTSVQYFSLGVEF